MADSTKVPFPASVGTRWVLCSEEIIQQMQKDWSEPVRFRVTDGGNGELKIVAQRVEPSP